MKVTSEIFQVGGQGFTSDEDAASYLIVFDGIAVLVDAGCGRWGDRLLENIVSCGVAPENIEYLLLTHCHFDHTGGARGIKEASGCQIIAHEMDAHFIESGDDEVTAAVWYGCSMEPLPVDRKLSGKKEIVRLGERKITAIHCPGHSPGSVVYQVVSDGKNVIFAQDVHGPLHHTLLSQQVDYQRSLEYLLSLKADILCEGHYGVYKGRRAVQDFINTYLGP